jgi:DNA replication protein DnaC
LHAARANGTHRRRLQRLASVDVLALDDFGLRPLSPEMAEDLYELIRERYERKALILTSNRVLVEWPDANNLLASAALDRLTHHCHVLVIRGESFRQRGRRKEDRPPDLTPASTPELDSWPTPR